MHVPVLFVMFCFSVAVFPVYIQVTVMDHVDEVSMILLCHESSLVHCVLRGGMVEKWRAEDT